MYLSYNFPLHELQSHDMALLVRSSYVVAAVVLLSYYCQQVATKGQVRSTMIAYSPTFF